MGLSRLANTVPILDANDLIYSEILTVSITSSRNPILTGIIVAKQNRLTKNYLVICVLFPTIHKIKKNAIAEAN